jgi:hypothetical protein
MANNHGGKRRNSGAKVGSRKKKKPLNLPNKSQCNYEYNT